MAILTVEELEKIAGEAKAGGLSVGLCHGCFDIIHIGHIRHFMAAKAQCDLLFVSITADRFVNKGPDRPVIPEAERAEVVDSLSPVTGVVVNQHPTSVELLKRVRPTVYFKGQEYLSINDDNFRREKEIALGLGIELRHTFEKVCSSSKIISTLRKPPISEIKRLFPDIN